MSMACMHDPFEECSENCENCSRNTVAFICKGCGCEVHYGEMCYSLNGRHYCCDCVEVETA